VSGPRDQDRGTDDTRRRVALGVTGSIAAYKAADLASRLVRAGVDVHVLMTASAAELVRPRTFLTLSRNPVVTDLWQVPAWQPGHIALADLVQLLIVAPATANFLAKLAHGIADDALSTFAVAHAGPMIVAPAMNPRMWANPTVQANCAALRRRGILFVGPDTGRVACGEAGVGRMAAVETILDAVRVQLVAAGGNCGAGRRVLVTAGPTREAIDPVRFITNRSSGKMGYALAAAAAAAGADTVLISGPAALEPPPMCRRVRVESAADMAAAVYAEFEAADLIVMAAAVADYRPVDRASAKIHKDAAALRLELERTEDILASLGERRKASQILVGFAAETERVAESAKEKLARKRLDFIVANDVSRPDIGFGSDENEVTVYFPGGEKHFPKMPKPELAAELMRFFLA